MISLPQEDELLHESLDGGDDRDGGIGVGVRRSAACVRGGGSIPSSPPIIASVLANGERHRVRNRESFCGREIDRQRQG